MSKPGQERTPWQKIVKRIRVPMGFVVAGLFLWLARPHWATLAGSLLLVVPGVWLRGYSAGYIRKNAELTRTGPYAHTRNPLYLGSLLIAFGFGVAAWSLPILIALAVLFFSIYLPTITAEEGYLREHFAGFDEYAAEVPRLWPRLSAAGGGGAAGERGKFSKELYLHHREYNAGVGAVAIYAALAARLLFFPR